MLKTIRTNSYDEIDQVAIAIQTSRPPDQRHVGFFYRIGTELHILHLAFHFLKRNEAVYGDYGWVEANLHPYVEEQLVATIMNVADDPTKIGYAFSPYEDCFEPDTGRYIKIAPGEGLTCATFLLSILSTLELHPIDAASWKEQIGDDTWREGMIAHLEDWFRHPPQEELRPSAAHIESLKTSLHNPRIRPEEVVAAFGSRREYWPFTQRQIAPFAKLIVDDLAAKRI